MDVVLIFNGLGNQMSQYAFYLAKRERNSHCVAVFNYHSRKEHNGFELGDIFGIYLNKNLKSRILQLICRIYTSTRFSKIKGVMRLLGVRIINETPNYDYTPKMLNPYPALGINFYEGGWHSEKYFVAQKNEVKSIFRFPPINNESCLRFVNIIKSVDNSVSLHVRRGDYLNIKPDNVYQLDGVASPDYYTRAIKKILSIAPDCRFFIFSDDLKWCRKEFACLDAYYVDCNIGKDSWRDMYLMTLCKHHINANSTFSWWGAWLAERSGITICPKNFLRNMETKDIYPESWIKL